MKTHIHIHDNYIRFTDQTWHIKAACIALLIIGSIGLTANVLNGLQLHFNLIFGLIYTIISLYILITSNFKKNINFEDIESVHIDTTWRNRIKFKLKSGKSRRVWTKCDNQSYKLIKESLNVDVKYSKI